MKKIIWAISCVPLIGTAIALQYMPETVPMHYDFSGNIDRWGSKYEALIFPAMILLLALVMTLIVNHYEKKAEKTADDKEKAEALSNAKILGIVGAALSALYCVMQGFILYGAYAAAKTEAVAAAVDIGKIACILMGVLFIVLGNYMTKTRINGVIGIRVSWSMYNDNTWRRSNRFGAIAIILEGFVAIAAALLLKTSFGAMIVTLACGCAAVAATLIYAHKVYVQEIETEKGGKDHGIC